MCGSEWKVIQANKQLCLLPKVLALWYDIIWAQDAVLPLEI